MPAVRTMLPLHVLPMLEDISRDGRKSMYERAYAGGSWLMVPASARTIDFQRTPRLWFENACVQGSSYLVACGIARASKGADVESLRPLAWRAPIVPCTQLGIDLNPLTSSMPDGAEGCVFRDFVTPPGCPHLIVHAISWADRPASHDTVVRSLRAILRPRLGDAVDSMLGHDERHVLPEVGRIARFPRHEREALGYWRQSPIVADTAEGLSARAHAITLARNHRSKQGAMAYMCDRYTSVDAEPVEQDNTRVACMQFIAAYVQQAGSTMPQSTRAQLEGIRSMMQFRWNNETR